MSRIYLDSAAATPADPRVVEAMLPFFVEKFQNPSALYEGARDVRASLEDARAQVAGLIGARPSEVIFTAGGTESANLAISGVMSGFTDVNLVVSAVEHDAVMKPAEKYEQKILKVDERGVVVLSELSNLCDTRTVLVSVMLVNNEVGSIQPIRELARVVEKIRDARQESGNDLPIYLHVDACQAPLYTDINVARLGVDLMTLNGGKIHGPKQSGILFVRAGVKLQPEIVGGGQEWGYRSGTENVAFAAGFARALELSDRGKSERVKKVSEVRDYFIKRLEDELGAELNGHRKNRIAHNVHVTFPGSDNERVLFALDDLGVDAAAGSACSASKDTSSHVLLAMGRTDEQARSSVRFSLLQTATKEDVDKAIDMIAQALKA